MTLERVRERAEEFLRARGALRLEIRTRRTRRPDLPAFLEAYRDLWRNETIAEVQRVLAGTSGEEERRTRALLELLVSGRAWAATAEASGRLLVWRLNGAAHVGERRIPLDHLPASLLELPAGEPRRVVEDAWLSEWAEMEDLVLEVRGLRSEVLLETGYGSLIETLGVLSGQDLAAGIREAEAFLAETADAYREGLSRFLPEHAGAEPARATMADRLVLDHARVSAPPHDLLARLEATTRPWRRPGGDTGLRIEEAADLPAGIGAVAEALAVPGEVRLVHGPLRNRVVVAALLEHLGRALHLASTPADLPMEQRWLGDEAATDAVGWLLRLLLLDGAWLHHGLEVPRPRRAERAALEGFLALTAARELAARLLAAAEPEDGCPSAEAFVEHLSGALGVGVDPRHHLRPGTHAGSLAARLRAMSLGSLFAGHLRERFDEDWFRNPAAAPELAGFLGSGRRFSSRELGVQVANRAPTLADLSRELRATG
jgi:hypothetical protein